MGNMVNTRFTSGIDTKYAQTLVRVRYSSTVVRDKSSSVIYRIALAMGARAPQVLGHVPTRTMKFVFRKE